MMPGVGRSPSRSLFTLCRICTRVDAQRAIRRAGIVSIKLGVSWKLRLNSNTCRTAIACRPTFVELCRTDLSGFQACPRSIVP